MKTRGFLMVVGLVGFVLLPAAMSGRRLAIVDVQLGAVMMAHEQTIHDVQEILDLRGRQEQIGLAERPTNDVIAQVNEVLAAIGVPSKGLKSLNSDPDTPLGDQYRRQSLRLVLEDLSVREIGMFLAAWQKSPAGKIWTPLRIELIHSRANGKTHSGRYDLTVLITAIYISQSKETS